MICAFVHGSIAGATQRVWRTERVRTGIVVCAEEGGAGCWFSMQSRCVCRGAGQRGGRGRMRMANNTYYFYIW